MACNVIDEEEPHYFVTASGLGYSAAGVTPEVIGAPIKEGGGACHVIDEEPPHSVTASGLGSSAAGVTPEVIGAPIEEGEGTAHGASLSDGQRLADLSGIVYPSIRPRAFLHASTVAIMLLYPVMAQTWPPLLPSGIWGGAAKAPVGGGHAERRYVVVLPFFLGVVNTYIIAMMGQPPFRVLTVHYSTYVILALLSQYFLGTASPAFVLVFLITMSWAFKHFKQRALVIVVFSSVVVLIVGMNVLYQILGSLVDMVPSQFLAGCLPPLISLSYGMVSYVMFSVPWKCLARPGLPPAAFQGFIANILAVGEAVRVTSLLAASASAVQVFGNLLTLVLGDIAVRCQALSYCMSLVRKSAFIIDAETDAFLRLRFTLGYVPVLPAAVIMASAALSGANWARQLRTWVVLAAYVMSNFVSDFAITFAHWDRKGFGSLLTTMKRLSMEPRTHWPRWQEPMEPKSPAEIWAPSGVARRWHWCSDELISAWAIVIVCSNFLVVCFVGFFTDCYIMVHEDNC